MKKHVHISFFDTSYLRLYFFVVILSLCGNLSTLFAQRFSPPTDSAQAAKILSEAEVLLGIEDYRQAIDLAGAVQAWAATQERSGISSRALLISARAYRHSRQAATALNYYIQSLDEFEKTGKRLRLAALNLEVADFYDVQEIPSKVHFYAADALEMYTFLKHKEGQLYALVFQGNASMDLGKIPSGITSYRRALRLAEEDATRLELSQKLAEAYQKVGSFNESFKYNHRVLALSRSLGDSSLVAASFNNLAFGAERLGRHEKAQTYFIQSILLSNDADLQADALSNLGVSLHNNGQTKVALERLRKALEIRKKLNTPEKTAGILNIISKIYFQIKDFHNASVYSDKAIEMARNARAAEVLRDCYSDRSDLARSGGNFELALDYYRKHLNIRDSLERVEDRKSRNQKQNTQFFESSEQDFRLLLEREKVDRLSRKRQELEVKQLQFAKDQQAREKELLQKDLDLKEANLQKESLEKLQALQELALARQRLETEQQSQEIAELAREKRSKELELEKKNLIEAQQKEEVRSLKREDLLSKQELQLSRTRQRSILGALILLAAIAAIFLFAFFQKRRANRQLSEQKEEIEKTHEAQGVTLYKLRAAQSKLVESEKMASLGQLTAGIAHELNNPINFVAGNVSPIREGMGELKILFQLIINLKNNTEGKYLEKLEEIKKYSKKIDAPYLLEEIDGLLEGIKEGADRSHEIVMGLRRFSRMDEDEFKFVDLHKGIDSTLTLLNTQLRNRITVHKDYGEIPLVECLPGKLNQVFMNILTNASQAIEGEGDIYITSKNTGTKAKPMVLISIRDSGRGMPEAVQKRIFEPFFTTKEVGEGTGLGLSISYGIIEQHGAEMRVNSEQGKGTEFLLELSVEMK